VGAAAGRVVTASDAGSVPENGGIMTLMPKRNAERSADEGDPLAAYRRVRKRVPPPSRVAPDRREKLRERAERRDRDADREPDINRDRS
jgi:hypothetical protein